MTRPRRRRRCRVVCRIHGFRCDMRRGHFDLHEHTDQYGLHRWDFTRSSSLSWRHRRRLHSFIIRSAQGEGATTP